MQRFDFQEVNNKMQIGLRISIRSTSEIPEGKLKPERDLQTLLRLFSLYILKFYSRGYTCMQ